MSSLNLIVILVTVFLSACAQLLLKLGVEATAGEAGIFAGGLSGLVSVVFSPFVILGVLIYGVSVIVWLWVLSQVDLSLAYPFVGISFIFTLLFGAFLLDEMVTMTRIAGTLMIAVGCVLVARSANGA